MIMGMRELLMDERLYGRVVDKYRMENGNIGLVVESQADRRRYAVEFQTSQARPCLSNLYGLVKEPFRERSEHLEHLITQGDHVDLAVGQRHGPLRTAYALYRVSANPAVDHRPERQGRPEARLLAYGPGHGY